MNRRPNRKLLYAVAVMLCASPFAFWARAQTVYAPPADARIRAVVTGNVAYLPGLPEMIVPARAAQVSLCPQGRYVLIAREEQTLPPLPAMGEPATGGASLTLWDGKTRKARTVWEQRAQNGNVRGSVGQIEWLPGTTTALVRVATVATDHLLPKSDPNEAQEVETLLLIDPQRPLSPVRTILSQVNKTALFLGVSPTLPVALVQHEQNQEPAQNGETARTVLSLVSTKGILSAPLPIAPGAGPRGTWNPNPLGWSADGTHAYLVQLIRARGTTTPTDPTPAPRDVLQWSQLDVRTGQVTLLDKAPVQKEPVPMPLNLPLRLVSSTELPVSQGKEFPPAAHIRPLWLEAVETTQTPKSASVYLAPDAKNSYLLPDLSAALYVSDNALYAVPLVHLARADFDEAQASAFRKRTLQNAKQVGLAFMMYVQDYDEVFPPSADVTDVISPYIKDATVFNNPVTGAPGFTYTLNGGTLANIKTPSTTEIGSLAGKGGRAIIYADGHVVWRDNP